MNRRQFLGRVFQSFISLKNANSAKYIYHPWRQYEQRGSVTIRLRMRTGDNPDYDSTITDPYDYRYGKYKYIDIPYTGVNGPIMAVYDSDGTMVYCSAYKSGSTIYNYVSYSISLGKLPVGKYTLKCLSLGRGLVLGESGQSVEFELGKIDRRYNADGSYNKNNNYGYISDAITYVDFLFDYEGLSFDLNIEYVPAGTDIRYVEGVKHAVYPSASYAEMKAVYGSDYTYDAFMVNAGYHNSTGTIPYEYLETYGDITSRKAYVTAYEHKGYDSKTERGKLDVSLVDNYCTTAVGFEREFKNKGLDFDPMTNILPTGNCTATVASAERINADGYDVYYYNTDDLHLLNTEPIIHASRYPACSFGSNGGGSGLKPEAKINSIGRSYTSVFVYTKRDGDYYDTSTKIRASVPQITFNYTETSYYECKQGEWFDNPMNGNQDPNGNTPAGNIKARVDYYLQNLKPNALKALAEAKNNWNVTDNNTWGFKKQSSNLKFSIPFDMLVGNCSGDYPVTHYDYNGVAYAVADKNSAGSVIGVRWEREMNEKIELHKALKTSINIEGYEFCKDFSTGWVGGNMVLRQEIKHIDISDVPDHRIYPSM